MQYFDITGLDPENIIVKMFHMYVSLGYLDEHGNPLREDKVLRDTRTLI